MAQAEYSEEQIQRSSLFAFALANKHIVPPNGWYPEALHLWLCNLCQSVIEQGRRAIICVPPQVGKSFIVSVFAPTWYLKNHPDARVGLITYGQDLADSKSKQVRALIQETYGRKLSKDSTAVSDWKLDGAYDTSFRARGISGGVTGNTIDGLLLLDDLIKNREEAENGDTRKKIMDDLESSIFTRLAEGTPVLGVMTRWHLDDYSKHLVERFGFEYYSIPALCVDPAKDLLGRSLGESIVPQLKSKEFFERVKSETSDYWWACLYQQNPQSREEARIKREWFKYFDESEIERVKNRYNIYQTVDTAASEKETADYFVILTFAIVTVNTATGQIMYQPSDLDRATAQKHELKKCIFILNVTRNHIATTEHERTLDLERQIWKPQTQYVEKAAFGLAIIQNAKLKGLPVRELEADRSKFIRSEQISVYYRDGRVYHPEGTQTKEMMATFENEITEFGIAAHDDQFDAVAYAGIVARKLNI